MILKVFALFSLIFFIQCQENKQIIKSENIIPAVEPAVSSGRVKDGLIKEFWPDHSLKATGSVANFKKTGKWVFYREGSGGLKKQFEGEFSDDLKNGQWIEYSKTGIIIEKTTYRKGILDGPRSTFYESGIPHLDLNYTSGKINGKFQDYNSDGKPKELAWFRDDTRNGPSTLFHPNGSLAGQGHYENGKKNGWWKFNNEKGTLASEGNYKDDQKIGKWKYYNDKGQVVEEK